jgi:hypothetical protein
MIAHDRALALTRTLAHLCTSPPAEVDPVRLAALADGPDHVDPTSLRRVITILPVPGWLWRTAAADGYAPAAQVHMLAAGPAPLRETALALGAATGHYVMAWALTYPDPDTGGRWVDAVDLDTHTYRLYRPPDATRVIVHASRITGARQHTPEIRALAALIADHPH